MKLSILIPTRQRSGQLREFVESFINNVEDSDFLEFCFRVDKDDIESLNKLKELNGLYPQIKWCIGNRDMMSKLAVDCYHISTGNLIMLAGDDIRCRNKAFDIIIIESIKKYPDEIFLLYFEDGYIQKNQRFGTHLIISRKWTELLGYCNPPYFTGSYIDTYLNRIADILNRKELLPIYVEHLHPAALKSKIDLVMQEKFQREAQQRSGEIYYSLHDKILQEAEKLWRHICQQKKEYCKNSKN